MSILVDTFLQGYQYLSYSIHRFIIFLSLDYRRKLLIGRAVAGLGETSPVLSNRYYFCFFDSSDRYILVVYGEAEHISELQQSFIRILPMILLMVLKVSFAVSGLYSRMITKPVLEISRISEKNVRSAVALDSWQTTD